jgi:hypothetical protein
VLSWTELDDPSVVYRTPPPLVVCQKSTPFVLHTLRAFPGVALSAIAVVVSMIAFMSMRPITRLIAELFELVMLAVPTAAS